MLISYLPLEVAIDRYLRPMKGAVRISYANLVTHIVCEGEVHAIAVRNAKSYASGETKWQALGGAASLEPDGVEYLEKYFGANGFEIDEEDGKIDCRFLANGRLLPDIARFLIEEDSGLVEQSPNREFFQEVESSILSGEEESLRFETLGIAIQPPVYQGDDTSRRGKQAGVPSRRIFRCWSLGVSEEIMKRVGDSDQMKFVNERFLRLTDNGRYGASLPNGSLIANNLGVPIYALK